jgi:hypothetical protein
LNVKFIHAVVLILAGTARADLIYELTPDVYTALPGGTTATFARVTNTGPEELFYAYSFVDPGTVPASGITGQLPPAFLLPGDSVAFTAAEITTPQGTAAAKYTFTEGVGYYRGPGVSDVVEARDAGTLVVVPEPSSLFLCGLSLFSLAAFRSKTIPCRMTHPPSR